MDRWWHPGSGGQLAKEAPYSNGIPSGAWCEWNRQGELVSTKVYRRHPDFRVINILDFGRRDVRTFTFHSASRLLFVSHGCEDDALYQWDVDAKRLVHTYHLGRDWFCDEVAASPHGRYLVVGCFSRRIGTINDSKTVIIDLEARRMRAELDTRIRLLDAKVLFSPANDKFRIEYPRRGLGDETVVYDVHGNRLTGVSARIPYKPPPPRLWEVPCSKDPLPRRGLYYRNEEGVVLWIRADPWHDNYGLTKDERYIVATNWDDDIQAWDAATGGEVFRYRTSNHSNGGGYLCYDEKQNRFLIGDASYKGTTWLRALEIAESQ